MKPTAPMQNIRWHRSQAAATMMQTVAGRITELANAAIAKKGSFHIVLAGGETPREIYRHLRTAKTGWQHWHVYFGDERCRPTGFPDRNDTMAFDTLLAHVPIPREQIHRIPAELPQQQCVEQYTETLAGVGPFDLVLLGLGEDGHTASLFPGHAWGKDANAPAVLALERAPVAPPQRISLSARRLSEAEHVWFIVCGSNKQKVLLRWQNGEFLPVCAINPRGGLDVFVAP